jgi:hypothetical protein
MSIAGWSSLVARRAHNPKVRGSNPLPATNKSRGYGVSCNLLVFQQDTNRTVAGQWLQTLSLPPKIMAKEKDKENRPIVSMKGEEREEVWDEAYAKEEGIILEFDSDSNTGKIKSLLDGSIYTIDSRELLRTKIELRPGDKVLFAPFEDRDGNDYARVIRIIELNA